MLTIVTAMPWEAGRFAARLRGRRRADLGDGAWAIRGKRGAVQLRVVVSGPGEDRAEAAAAALPSLDPPASGVLSVGVAGGLDPALKPGALVLASRVHHRRARGGRRGPPRATDPRFHGWIERALSGSGITVTSADLLHRDVGLVTRKEKQREFEQTHTVAVQMEDYVWAQHAAEHGLPFASLRAILDPAGANLPPQILTWGGAQPSVARIAAEIARHPPLVVGLSRLGLQHRRSVRALDRAVEAIVRSGAPPPEAGTDS